MANAIEAGRAFMRLYLNDAEFKRGLDQATYKLRALGKTVAGLGAKIGAVGLALGAPFVAAVKAAGDAQEVFSKFNVVFGELSDNAKKFGDNLASSVGRSRSEISGFLAGFQDLLVPIGIDPSIAAETSKQLTQLAVDLASFNNKADSDAVRDLQAALTGSGEVMKKYGVIVSEAAVKQQLLSEGIDPKGATESQKVFARLSIILAGTTAAQGDAARTAGSFSNQVKALRGKIKDLAEIVGNALVPAATAIVSAVGSAVTWFEKFAAENQKLIVVVAGAAAGMVALGAALVTIGGTFSVAASAITGVGVAVKGLSVALTFLAANPMAAAIALIGTIVAGLGAWAVASRLVGDETTRTAEAMKSLNDEIAKFNGQIDQVGTKLDGVRSKLEQFQNGQSLTLTQIIEQGKVVSELEKQYGELGFAYDATTHAISNLDEVFARLTTEQKKAAAENALGQSLSLVNDEISATEAELKNLQGDLRALSSVPVTVGPPGGNLGRISRVEDEIDAVVKKLDALKSRRDEIKLEFDAKVKDIEQRGSRAVENTAKEVGRVANQAGQQIARIHEIAFGKGLGAIASAFNRLEKAAVESAESMEREREIREALKNEAQSIGDQIAALQIKRDLDGPAEQKALLDLQLEQEKRRLALEGLLTKGLQSMLEDRLKIEKQLIDEEEEKRKKRAKELESGLRRATAVSRGTFSSQAIAAQLSPSNSIDRKQLQQLQEINKHTKKAAKKPFGVIVPG